MGAELRTRLISSEDYTELVDLWRSNGWEPPPLDWLPPAGLAVTGPEGKILAAGWFYATGTRLGFVEWLISDPGASRQLRARALDLLMEKGLETLDKLGIRDIITMTKSRAVLRRYQDPKWGFTLTDEGVSVLCRRRS